MGWSGLVNAGLQAGVPGRSREGAVLRFRRRGGVGWLRLGRAPPYSARHPLASAPRHSADSRPHVGTSRLRILTRLYAAAVNVNTQPTFGLPRWRVLRINPTVFIQPKTSSTRFLRFWLCT